MNGAVHFMSCITMVLQIGVGFCWSPEVGSGYKKERVNVNGVPGMALNQLSHIN